MEAQWLFSSHLIRVRLGGGVRRSPCSSAFRFYSPDVLSSSNGQFELHGGARHHVTGFRITFPVTTDDTFLIRCVFDGTVSKRVLSDSPSCGRLSDRCDVTPPLSPLLSRRLMVSAGPTVDSVFCVTADATVTPIFGRLFFFFFGETSQIAGGNTKCLTELLLVIAARLKGMLLSRPVVI